VSPRYRNSSVVRVPGLDKVVYEVVYDVGLRPSGAPRSAAGEESLPVAFSRPMP
jgi:hypothetical protein